MTTLLQYPLGNSRTNYIIPDTVTNIGNNAFFSCSSLESITIPKSVTSISNEAFSSCGNLKSITVERETPPNLGNRAFNNTHTTLKIYVPIASLDIYKNANGWNIYSDKIYIKP